MPARCAGIKRKEGKGKGAPHLRIPHARIDDKVLSKNQVARKVFDAAARSPESPKDVLARQLVHKEVKAITSSLCDGHLVHEVERIQRGQPRVEGIGVGDLPICLLPVKAQKQRALPLLHPILTTAVRELDQVGCHRVPLLLALAKHVSDLHAVGGKAR